MILNQIIATNWNYAHINDAFDIYSLSFSEISNKNILDIQDDEFKMVSTVYLYGNMAFCMTRKNASTEGGLKDCILRHFPEMDKEKLKVEKIPLLQISMFGEERLQKAFGYKKQALLQLLINSTLNNPVFEDELYNNITGRCYYYNRLWNENPDEKIELVDFTLDHQLMYPTVATFIKEKPKLPSYKVVYDRGKNIVRKAQPGDKDNDIYYRKGIDGTHATRHANGTTLDKWETSRLACLAKFYIAVKDELADYINIEFNKVETEVRKVPSLDIGYEAIAKIHRANGINIVDQTVFSAKENQAQSNIEKRRVERINQCREQVKDAIKDYCEKNNILFKESASRDIYHSNLCIVRDKDFFKYNHDLRDSHVADKNCLCQHVTVPFLSNGFKEMIDVVLKELVIKSDLIEKRIRLTDWTKFGCSMSMNFYIAKNTRNEDGTTTVRIAGMTIHPNGSFVTNQILIPDANNFDSQNYDQNEYNIINCFRSKYKGETFFDRKIEMALWPENDIFDAYLIKRTDMRAISDIEKMKASFDDEKEDTLYDVETLLDAIKDFRNCGNPRHEEVSSQIYDALLDRQTITKKELIPLLRPSIKEGSSSTRIDSAVKEAISNATHSVIRVSRTNENEEKMGLDVYKHIHLWKSIVNDKYNKNPCVIYLYTVGMVDKPKQTIANSPVVRQIYKKDGTDPEKYFIDIILSMLQVGFVKFKNYTVLPFPAKYLREEMAYI